MSRKTSAGLAALVLLLMAAMAGGAALHQSVTVDEVAHLGAGVSYLQKLDMRMNIEHPPLAKVLAGLPLAIGGARADYQSPAWTFAQEGMFPAFLAQWSFGHLFLARWNNPAVALAWGRFPMLALMVALGALIYLYGSRLGGEWGGLLAVTLYASMPAFLTFGPLVITDIPIAFFVLLTMWTFAALWESSGENRRVWPFALALSGALLTKFSAGILLFAFLAFRISLRFLALDGFPYGRDEARAWRRAQWRAAMRGILWAGVIVYVVYFVLSINQSTDSLQVLGTNPAALVLRRLLMPLWIYVRGLGLFGLMSVRPAFLLGHTYSHGVWYYFPVVFLLKTPLAALAILLLALPVGWLARRKRAGKTATISPDRRIYWRATWVFLAVFTAFCMISQTTISIRHFTTPMALLILSIAPLPRALAGLRESGVRFARPLGWLTAGLAAASLVTTALAYPYFMPFLNSLSLTRPNYSLVADSNLDWNQALLDVRRFAEQRKLDRVLLDEYGFSDPVIYIPQAEIWNCQKPAASDGGRWAVVSAAMILDGHNCGWLTRYPHEVLAGGGMYAFRLPAPIPAAGTPDGPPRPAEFRNLGGMPGEMDMVEILHRCIQDPYQLKPTMDKMMADFERQPPADRSSGYHGTVARRAAKSSSSFVLVLIGAFKLLKALLLIAVAIGAIKLLHRDIAGTVMHWIQVLRVDPDNHFVHGFLEKIFRVTPRQLKELSIGTFLYAGLFATEGVGLLLRKRWAEYFTIITTGGLIPLEIFELVRHFTVMKLIVTIVNVLIVWYLVARVRSH
jgi:uncharacterized membrane protein (DUF2068 family)